MPSNIRCEIIVWINDVAQYVDTSDVESVPLEYQISDIRDFDKRRSGSSLTIKLPETSNNRKVFNDIANLSTDLTYFNPNLKTRVEIIVESITVFEGILQLTDVEVDNKRNVIGYNCNLFSDNDDFFSNVGDLLITDMDWSELSHTYSQSNITNSWTTYNSGYYYPLIEYGQRGIDNMNNPNPTYSQFVKVEDFKPATYIKYIWDKIFTEAGYSYESEFLTSDTFRKLIFPFSEPKLSTTQDYRLGQEYEIGLVNPYNALVQQGGASTTPQFLYNQILFNKDSSPFYDDSNLWNTATFQLDNNSDLKNEKIKGTITMVFMNGTYLDKILLVSPGSVLTLAEENLMNIYLLRSKYPSTDDNLGVVAGQNSPHYNIDFTGDVISGDYNLEKRYLNNNLRDMLIDGRQPLIPMNNGESFLSVKPPVLNLHLGGGIFANGITFSDSRTFDLFPGTLFNNFNNPSNITFATVSTAYGIRMVAEIGVESELLDNRPPVASGSPDYECNCEYTPLFPAEHYKVMFSCAVQKTAAATDPMLQMGNVADDTFIGNELDSKLMEGQYLDYNTAVPQNLKQKDFLTSIIKMFNLYIEPSKDNPYSLIIEPRDDYYENGETLDWSYKVDQEYPIQEIILSETQDRSTLFTYKGDTDFWNQDYFGKLKRYYGDLRYTIENDFIKKEKKVEVIFSPTPLTLLQGSKEIVLSTIFKVNNGVVADYSGFNYRILMRGASPLPLQDRDNWYFKSTKMATYPYAGHFDDPYTPTYDLNLGQSYLYYGNTPTNNNLFNLYWKSTMDELSNINSRLVKLRLKLTTNDIGDLRFNSKLFIVINGVGEYYRLNKITYDATSYDSCQVELLKIIDDSRNLIVSTNTPPSEVVRVPTGEEGIIGVMSPLGTNGNTTNSRGVILNGATNMVDGQFVNVTGFNNNVASGISTTSGVSNVVNGGDIKLVTGSFNRDHSQGDSFIFGDSNSVGVDVTSSFIGGNGNINTGDNNIIIGNNNQITSNNSITIGSNIKSPSNNVTYIGNALVVGPNYIQSGYDDVLNPFSTNIINIFGASRDAVRNLGSHSPMMIISAGRDEV